MNVKITASGGISCKPDQATFLLTFNQESKDSEEIIKNGSEQIVEFQNLLKQLEIDKQDLKTTRYEIIPVKNTIEDKNDIIEVSYVFSHYELIQTNELTINYSSIENILNIIDAISKMKNPPTYTIKFGVNMETRNKLEEEALANAIKLAEEKAEFIKNTMSKSNKTCLFIEVHNNFQDFDSDTNLGMSTYLRAGNSLDTINPEDINIEASITSEWEFE